jgi:hypothetical protein
MLHKMVLLGYRSCNLRQKIIKRSTWLRPLQTSLRVCSRSSMHSNVQGESELSAEGISVFDVRLEESEELFRSLRLMRVARRV